MTPPILSMRNVSMRFEGLQGTTVALRGVDLEVETGEILCLLGPSGCGKSTILNLGAGLLFPSSGDVLFEGAPVKGPDPVRGVIFQQYALFPWMTVQQNVEFGLKLKKVRRPERAEIAKGYLRLVGLEQQADVLPKELSGGMKQRVAIARAYAPKPHLLFMDEPFGSLDAQARLRLQIALIETWQQERPTICFVTHDIEEAILLGHRIAIMASNPGRIKRIVEVAVPHPRGVEFRLSAEFAEIRNGLWDIAYADEPIDGGNTSTVESRDVDANSLEGRMSKTS